MLMRKQKFLHFIKLLQCIGLLLIFLMDTYLMSYADNPALSNSENVNKTPRAILRNDAIIPTILSIRETSAKLKSKERRRVVDALVQYLSEAQFKRDSKSWVAAVAAKEEYLTSKITIPVLAVIAAEEYPMNKSGKCYYSDDVGWRFQII